jgi:RNA polymerase sigma-70 factor (ECF subfamily)
MVRTPFDQRLAAARPKLREFLRKRVGCDATADDLAQETLIKAFRARESLRDATRFEAWMYRIARRALIDHRRTTKSDERLSEEPVAEIERDRWVTEVVARAAKCYIGLLPAEYREPVRLAEIDAVPHAEIARRLGVSLTAVKSRVRRGKQRVRAFMERDCRLTFDRRGRVVDCESHCRCGG